MLSTANYFVLENKKDLSWFFNLETFCFQQSASVWMMDIICQVSTDYAYFLIYIDWLFLLYHQRDFSL